MSTGLIMFAVIVSQVFLGLAMLCTVWRMVVGPRAQDRVLALDAFYITAMLILMTVGIRTGLSLYFEVALLTGALGFVGTVALAKFLMRGEVIE